MKSRKKNHHNISLEKTKRGKRVSGKTGLPPGSLVHIGKVFTETVTVSLIEYNPSSISQNVIKDLTGLNFIDDSINRWIEISGLHETKIIETFGNVLNINPLILEDILNTEHRPKSEIQDGMLFLTLKAFSISDLKEIQSEQVSFVLGNGFLISFLESNHKWFEPVSSLLLNGSGKIRQRGLDFLLYSLIDVIIDQYYEIVEAIGDQLEELEEMIFENPSQELIEKIRLIKKDIISIRKALLPALEAMNKLKRDEPDLILHEVLPYYDDIRDHIVQILDYLDTYRELGAELKENYISNITLRMNKVIKLLTIITSIFIPLTFIAGIYGMNFPNIPEFSWKYGYFIILGIMFTLTAAMLIYFKKKKWF
jgi:magnesium transporter